MRSVSTPPPRPDNFPLASTVEDPASARADSVDLLGASDFSFVMGDGSGRGGYDIIKIGADGGCEYVFSESFQRTLPDGSSVIDRRWKQATFMIDRQTLDALRRLLVDIDYFRLKKEYHANVADGTQRSIVIIISLSRSRGCTALSTTRSFLFMPPQFSQQSQQQNQPGIRKSSNRTVADLSWHGVPGEEEE